jgi:hypothetical protein
MNAHSAPSQQDHFDAARHYQEYYDNALREVGVRAPPVKLGQTVNEYRRETLHALKRSLLRNHKLNDVDFRDLKTDSLAALEPQCLAACKTERANPRNVPPGQLQPIKVRNEFGHLQETKFIGSYDPRWNTQESFVKQLTRAGRRVTSFATGDGRLWDALKGSWR